MILGWNVSEGVSEGNGAGVGVLQPVFSVGFDPRPQCHDRNPS